MAATMALVAGAGARRSTRRPAGVSRNTTLRASSGERTRRTSPRRSNRLSTTDAVL